MPALRVSDLCVAAGETILVEDVSFEIGRGETLALVGESGSGKSMTALAVMGLLRGCRIVSGRVELAVDEGNIDLARLPPSRLRHYRGRHIGMVFQEAMSVLNPALRIGTQFAEVLRMYRRHSAGRSAIRDEGLSLLRRTGISDPGRCWNAYPHEMSGGMCQRVGVALALAPAPRLLIADEPTTALDYGTRGLILELIREMASERGTATLFITHDFGAAAAVANRTAVMYAGRMVEIGVTATVMSTPSHPYTRALLDAMPGARALHQDASGRMRMRTIDGQMPPPDRRPVTCAFASRCIFCTDDCLTMPVRLRSSGHRLSSAAEGNIMASGAVACLRAAEWDCVP